MNVQLYPSEARREPHQVLFHEQHLAMVLRPGCIEVGVNDSEMASFTYHAGETILSRRHVEEWVRMDDVLVLTLCISDSALAAACNEINGEVELTGTPRVEDQRVNALAAAVNAERAAGFPGGRLFLDSVEQALAAALVDRYAVRHRPARIHRGGLSHARLRRVVDLIQARLEDDLTLHEMAESAGLSTAHFLRAFRKSMGHTPHQFVLRLRMKRAKEMLRLPEARVLDVAVACGFKTQQHFARTFRRAYGASPTEYRYDCMR